VSQGVKDLADALFDIFTGSVALLLDGLFNLCSLFFLGVGELLDRLDVTGSAQVNKLERGLHLHHQASVLAEVVPEEGL